MNLIHHKNKNPLTQFPSSPDKVDGEDIKIIQTEALEFDGKISNIQPDKTTE